MNMPKPPVMPRYSPTQATLSHNKHVKEMMSEAVIDTLYSNVGYELIKELGCIARLHTAATGSSYTGFLYRGKHHNEDPTMGHNVLILHESLHSRMNDYLAEYHQVYNYEIPCIKGILNSMFIASDRISDYKQILPEQVHRAFEHFVQAESPRCMQPNEIVRMQKRIEPFITIMKSRMLQNFVQGHQP